MRQLASAARLAVTKGQKYMLQRLVMPGTVLLAAVLIGGCASSVRQLMPTLVLYQQPGGQPVFDRPGDLRQGQTQIQARGPDVDLLFITDRAPPTPEELAAQAKDQPPLPSHAKVK